MQAQLPRQQLYRPQRLFGNTTGRENYNKWHSPTALSLIPVRLRPLRENAWSQTEILNFLVLYNHNQSESVKANERIEEIQEASFHWDLVFKKNLRRGDWLNPNFRVLFGGSASLYPKR